ncbi:MAG: transposase [Alphaproteobacteria bacterium]|nr:transposase [Alphaproteobacteria bacterium]
MLILCGQGAEIMRSNLFWLNDEQWQQIEPLLPTDVRGKPREDDRRVIIGILHVLKGGCRWKDCPPEYGRTPSRSRGGPRQPAVRRTASTRRASRRRIAAPTRRRRGRPTR